MQKFFLWASTVLMCAIVVACGFGCQTVHRAQIDKLLIGDIMMNTELPENLRELSMEEGRISGSKNGHKAERFVAGKCREYGLSNVHFEPFEMQSWQDISTTVTLLGDEPRVLEGSLSLGNVLSTPPEGITGELVNLNKGTKEDFEAIGSGLKGKIGIVREGGLHRGRKMALALECGAIGLIQISRLEDHARVGQCHPTPRPEPGVVVTGRVGDMLVDRLDVGDELYVNIKIEARSWRAKPNNVIAEIPGRLLADEVVIACAHLDSWHLGEGALDNATGSTAILEAARALSAAKWRPKRTIRFIWFMGEEHGLHGSRAYVERRKDELDNIVTVLNCDMVGSPRFLYSFVHEEIVPFLKSVRDDLPGYRLREDIPIHKWTASDHAAFMKQGVSAIGLSGEMGEGVQHYHSFGDTYEAVDLRATNESAAVIAVLLRRLADEPQRPTIRLAPEALVEKYGW